MRRTLNTVIEHAHWFVVVGFTLCALLAAILSLATPGGNTIASLGHGVETSLSILMTLDSPKSALASSCIPIRVMGWLVAFFGWLTIPALLGVVISRTAVTALREKEFEFAITSMARDARGGHATKKILKAMIEFQEELLRDPKTGLGANDSLHETNAPQRDKKEASEERNPTNDPGQPDPPASKPG